MATSGVEHSGGRATVGDGVANIFAPDTVILTWCCYY